MVHATHRLVTEGLGVAHLRLVMGTSMGAMHSWVYGYLYPDFMDALMPLASAPVAIAGRNRMFRAMIMQAIKADPEYKDGEYTKPPLDGLVAAQYALWMMTSSPLQLTKTNATREQADAAVKALRERAARVDANDMMYQYDSSSDYNPAPHLGKIRAPLFAVNSADDLIKGRVSIALRPQAVDLRRTFGHWEGDLMAFAIPGQTILVAHERKSRLILGARQPGKAPQPVAKQLCAWFQPLDPRLRRTITFDNGTEFAQHLVLTDELAIRTFFCDPYSPWQKGAVENAIGRLRRCLPRNTDLDTLDRELLEAWIAAYNNTPRKCLRFRSPAEVFLDKVLHFECESTPSLRSG